MKVYLFEVVIEDDQFPDGTKAYHAYCPTLKGCRTWGYTIEEAREKIKEAIELCLESLKAHGEPIPNGVLEQEVDSESMPINTKIPVSVC